MPCLGIRKHTSSGEQLSFSYSGLTKPSARHLPASLSCYGSDTACPSSPRQFSSCPIKNFKHSLVQSTLTPEEGLLCPLLRGGALEALRSQTRSSADARTTASCPAAKGGLGLPTGGPSCPSPSECQQDSGFLKLSEDRDSEMHRAAGPSWPVCPVPPGGGDKDTSEDQ